MSNVFANNGSGSDSSGMVARRRRRPQPPLDDALLLNEAPPGVRVAADRGGDDDDGVGDDEEELRRMRGSSGYAQYSSKYAREDAKAERDRRRRRDEEKAEALRRITVRSDGDESEGEGGADISATKAVAVVDDDDDDDEDDVVPGPALPPGVLLSPTKLAAAESALERLGPVTGAPSPSRARRTIDPKIVDDSSDGGDSDGDDDDGAALPSANGRAKPSPGSLKNALDALPLTHEASLGSKHDAYVSSIALDSAGSRVVTASTDSTIRLWDFGTMDSGLRAFRNVEPLDAGPVFSVQFSASGGRILCAGALTVARVLDRDARPLVESIPGDMYITDMARTRGHVAPLNGAQWLSDQRFASIAGDGTLRLWDVAAATAPQSVFDGELPRAKQLKVVKLRTAMGGKKANATAMTVLEGSSNPRVAVGCDDGSIKVIDPEAFALRPSAENGNAVSRGAEYTSLRYRSSSSLLLARSSDNALRVFDLRRIESPLAEFLDLPNAVAQTGVAFMGEGGSHFVTGTSGNRRGGTDSARLIVYNSSTLTQVWESAVEQERGSVVPVLWHPRINQLLYGCADGTTHVMYTPETSRAGVLQCLVKQVRRKVQHGMASVAVGEIYTPSSLAEAGRRRKQAPVSAPEKNDAPDPAKMTSTFTKAFMKSKVKSQWADEDPREALLRYKKQSDSKPILAEKTLEEEEEEELGKLRARDRVGGKRPRER